jgi:hypothetical protein
LVGLTSGAALVVVTGVTAAVVVVSTGTEAVVTTGTEAVVTTGTEAVAEPALVTGAAELLTGTEVVYFTGERRERERRKSVRFDFSLSSNLQFKGDVWVRESILSFLALTGFTGSVESE